MGFSRHEYASAPDCFDDDGTATSSQPEQGPELARVAEDWTESRTCGCSWCVAPSQLSAIRRSDAVVAARCQRWPDATPQTTPARPVAGMALVPEPGRNVRLALGLRSVCEDHSHLFLIGRPLLERTLNSMKRRQQ